MWPKSGTDGTVPPLYFLGLLEPSAVSIGFLVARTDRLSEQKHMLPPQATEQHGRVVKCSQHLHRLLRPQCSSGLGGGGGSTLISPIWMTTQNEAVISM